jgi:hypothetical protein
MVELASAGRFESSAATSASRRSWVGPLFTVALIVLAVLYIHVPALKNQEIGGIGFSPAGDAADSTGMGKQVGVETNETTSLRAPVSQGGDSTDLPQSIRANNSSKPMTSSTTTIKTSSPTSPPTAAKKTYTVASVSVHAGSHHGTTNIVATRPSKPKPPPPPASSEPVLYPFSLDPVPSSFDFTTWKAQGGGRYAEYTSGKYRYNITAEIRQKSDEQARSRRLHIKNAMKFA